MWGLAFHGASPCATGQLRYITESNFGFNLCLWSLQSVWVTYCISGSVVGDERSSLCCLVLNFIILFFNFLSDWVAFFICFRSLFLLISPPLFHITRHTINISAFFVFCWTLVSATIVFCCLVIVCPRVSLLYWVYFFLLGSFLSSAFVLLRKFFEYQPPSRAETALIFFSAPCFPFLTVNEALQPKVKKTKKNNCINDKIY